MSSASFAVTYTSIYTNSEPGRVFWGADDEEVSEGGIPWVIVLGYDGLPMQPVAPPSPDYIPDSEDPQTPPVPQDEDEREPMFIQAHDPDYVPEPIYPEYIPLEDEHEFPAEEQPLPPVDSPTVESPGYVTKSDPKEDPEEYKDDESEDGLVDYPMDGGDDGDDDDGDSSGDDADDEDADEDDEEKEEHLAPADSTIVVPIDEPTSISLPLEAEVGRLLAMTTPSPSPPISLSPPSAGERLVRCMAPLAHSSPPPMPSPLLPSSGCPTQIQTLRIASTQAFIDAVTTALPSPPLPPSLYIPPPVDRRDDTPESEQPPRKRLCLSTLGSRYEIEESSTARPIRGRGIEYGFFSMVDAEERRQWVRDVGYGIRDTWVDPAEAVPEIAPMTVGEVNTRVTELAELHEHDTQDLYALLEDAQDSRSRISQRVDMDSQRVDLLMGDRMTLQETVWMVEEEAYASREAWAHSIGLSQATHQELQTHRDHTQLQLQSTLIQTQHQVHETRFQMQQAELAALRETDRRRQDQMVETLRVIRDMRREMSDMQAELLALREQQRRARQPGPGELDSQDQRLGFQITRMLLGMPTVTSSDLCYCILLVLVAIENQVKFATCTLLGAALTWWNGQIRTLGPEAYAMTWEVLKKKMTDKYCPQGEIKKLEIELWNLKSPANKLQVAIVPKAYNMGTGERKPYGGSLPKCTKCHLHHNGPCTQRCHKCNKIGHFARDCRNTGNTNVANTQKGNGAAPKGNGCFECGAPGHFKRDCPKLKNKDGGNGNAQGWVYAVGNAEKRGNASGNPDANIVTGTFLLNNHYASILFDTGVPISKLISTDLVP
ncbi:putative reverse transcriptase domain-containing protein [Tanacetum coccineum]